MTTNPITQTIRHVFVSNDAAAAAWSQLPEQITDALTREYVLTPRPATPLPVLRSGLHYQVPVEGLEGHDTTMASMWTTDEPEAAEDHAELHDRIAAGYRAIAAQLTSDQQDAKKQMDVKIRDEQRHEALRRILPEAAAANNLPAWDDLDLLQQRAVDQVVDLTNVVNGRATPAEADRTARATGKTWDPVYLRHVEPPFTPSAGIKLHGTDVRL